MIKIIANLFLVFNCLVCFGQVDSTNVPFLPYWSIGDSYNFRISHIKQAKKGKKIIKNDSISYIAKFEVIDSTELNYTIKWSYLKDLSGFNAQTTVNKFNHSHPHNKDFIIYKTTEVGEFVEIENWEKIAQNTNEMFKEMIDNASKYNIGNIEQLNNLMKALFESEDTKKTIELLFFKELIYIHYPIGLLFPSKKPIIYKDELPNIYGGSPIEADGKLYFEIADFEKSYCVMIQELNINPDKKEEIMLSLFQKLGFSNTKIKNAIKTAKFDIYDYNRYEYFFNPAIPIKIEIKRESSIKCNQLNEKYIDKTIIELIN